MIPRCLHYHKTPFCPIPIPTRPLGQKTGNNVSATSYSATHRKQTGSLFAVYNLLFTDYQGAFLEPGNLPENRKLY